MSYETKGKSDEWYTPKYIFDGLGCTFDLDVASPVDRTHCNVPAAEFLTENALEYEWDDDFIWMNPPFGDKYVKAAWYGRFVEHGNGIALSTDRTCTEWWHGLAGGCDAVLFFKGRPSFIQPDGTKGKGAGANSCLWAIGEKAVAALRRAEAAGLGKVFKGGS